MIFDDLSRATRYESLHRGLSRWLRVLARTDLAEMATGKYELNGDRIYALVNRDPGRGRSGARLEAHRKYIDIQMLVAGCEEIGWRPTPECQRLAEEYDPARDVMFFADEPQAWINLPIGKFMIFYPEDAHAPLAATGEQIKAVIKVAVD